MDPGSKLPLINEEQFFKKSLGSGISACTQLAAWRHLCLRGGQKGLVHSMKRQKRQNVSKSTNDRDI